MDDGGLGTLMPVLGLTIGIAFRLRKADGWWIFIWWLLLLLFEFEFDWKPVAGLYELFEAEDKEKVGVICCDG